MNSDRIQRLLWLDLEMSGLEVDTCRILEAAAIVTDLEFNELETYHAVIFQPPEILDHMNPWCKDHHGKSGLTLACRTGKSEELVASELRSLIERHWTEGQKPVLCGNSISTDKQFVQHWWPRVAERLHYRVLDVSSWKIIMKERFGLVVKKAGGHRALDDVRESIKELATYVTILDPEKLPSKS